MRASVMSALLVLVAGCSSQPTTQDPPASGATPIPPPPPVAEEAVPAPVPSTTQSVAGEKVRAKIPSGYRLERRKGKELYCRQVTTLGSRFAQKTCFTREQLEEIQRRRDSVMEDLEQGLKVCGTAEACGGTSQTIDRPGARPVQ
jgi:hypothetical protein